MNPKQESYIVNFDTSEIRGVRWPLFFLLNLPHRIIIVSLEESDIDDTANFIVLVIMGTFRNSISQILSYV